MTKKNIDLHPPKDSTGHGGGPEPTEPTKDQVKKLNAKPKPDVTQPEPVASDPDAAPIGTVLQDIPADEGPDASKDEMH